MRQSLFDWNVLLGNAVDAGEIVVPQSVMEDALQAVPQFKGGGGEVKGNGLGVLQQQALRVFQIGAANLRLGGGVGDPHEHIIGAVGIEPVIAGIAAGPLAQKGGGIVPLGGE